MIRTQWHFMIYIKLSKKYIEPGHLILNGSDFEMKQKCLLRFYGHSLLTEIIKLLNKKGISIINSSSDE